MKEFFNIVLLGAPGSGKGTQADLIKRRYQMEHVSTGDLYRKEISSESEIGIAAKTIIEQGNLCPDSMTLDILFKYIQKHKRTKGYILDGVPRTLEQATMMEGIGYEHFIPINMVINISVTNEEIANRLAKRAILINRADDTPEVIQQRIVNYERQTVPLIEHYNNKKILYNINGMQSLEDVFKDICLIIDSVKHK